MIYTYRPTQKVDLRRFAPNDAPAYLEIADVSKTLDALTDNPTFQTLAKSKRDFSPLKNVQIAVIVTGFETSEKQITDENAVLNFQPHFVAVAETHAWEFQTNSLIENQLNAFVKERYGDDAKLETSNKNGGKSYVWTANDNRQVFAFVEKSRVYFGNDAMAIEKCLAAGRGEIENLSKNENLTRAFSLKSENEIAFGYVSPTGVAQIANLIGVSAAIETTEGEAERSFVARVLPPILRNTVREIVWTAREKDQKIEDNFYISLTNEVSSVFTETLQTAAEDKSNATEFLPDDIFSATLYNLKNPLLAWRSLLLATAKNTDAASGKLLIQFSGSLLEPYGISDAETFLSAVGSDILTAQFDTDGEQSVAVFTIKDAEKVKKSIAGINFKSPPETRENAEIWQSEDKTLAAAFVENKLVLGDAESVLKCLRTKETGQNLKIFPASSALSATFTKDIDSAEKIAEIFGDVPEHQNFPAFYLTKTNFVKNGIKRTTVSNFGLLGTILENINSKN